MSPTSIAAPAPTLSPQQLQRIQKSAQDFEAMAINQLLTPMFDTIDLSKNTFGGGEGEQAWRPMWIDSVAKQMAAHGGIGLADSIARQMIQIQEHKNDA